MQHFTHETPGNCQSCRQQQSYVDCQLFVRIQNANRVSSYHAMHMQAAN
jgi:hypothetical protein